MLDARQGAADLGRTVSIIVIWRFLRDESGATAIEYGLIVSLIAVAIITVLETTGANLKGVFTKVSGNLK